MHKKSFAIISPKCLTTKRYPKLSGDIKLLKLKIIIFYNTQNNFKG